MEFSLESTDEPTRAAQIGRISGLEFVTMLSAGTLPRPQMAVTLPFTLLSPEEGRVQLRATPEQRFLNTMKTVHGGWIMTMLDTSMALAAHTTLSPGELCPTHETAARPTQSCQKKADLVAPPSPVVEPSLDLQPRLRVWVFRKRGQKQQPPPLP